MIVEFQDYDPGDGFQVKIYNPTGSTINLSAYYLKVFNNGNITASSSSQLSGSLAPQTSLIVGNPHTCNSNLTFNVAGVNRDDCIALTLGNTTNFVDMINHYGTATRPRVDNTNNAMFHNKWVRNSDNCIRYTSTDGFSINSWKSNDNINNPGWTVLAGTCLSQTTGFAPSLPSSTQTQSICNGDSIYLQNAWRKSAGTYADTISGTSFCDSVVQTIVTVLPSPTRQITRTICSVNETVVFNGQSFTGAGTYQISKPSISTCDSLITLQVVQSSVLADFDFTYNLLDSTEITFINNSINAQRSTWFFGDGNTSNSDGLSVTHQYNNGGLYQVKLVVENLEGCKDSLVTSVYIPIKPELLTNLYIPNVFTPNGDGINDFFEIKSTNLLDFTFQIYNRWGSLLYQTNDPNFKWDGKYKGTYCAEGVYVFYLTGTQNKKGFLTLIR